MKAKLKTQTETTKSLYDQWQEKRYGNIYPEFQSPLSLTYDELKDMDIFSNPKIENI